MTGRKPIENTYGPSEVIGNVYRQGNYVYLPMWENTGTTINPIGPFSSSTWTLANAFGASQWIWSNTKHGIALEVGNGNDEINSNLSDADVFTQGYGTIMVSFYVGSSGFDGSGGAFLFSIENSSSGTNTINLFVSSDTTNFEFDWKANFGSGKAVYEPDGSTQVFPNDSVVTLVCRAAPSGKKIWYNGEEVYSDAVDPGARTPQTGDTFTLHNGGSGNIAPGGYYLATGIWDSVLSDQACRELSADPFLPVRSNTYPVDAAGGYDIGLAWSMSRYLTKAYADTCAPCVRLRRLTTNDEKDFYPDTKYPGNGRIVDSTGRTPAEWAGSEELGVAKIYDQSGNTEDLAPYNPTTSSHYARYADYTHSNGVTGWTIESPSAKPTLIMENGDGHKPYGLYQTNYASPGRKYLITNLGTYWSICAVGGVKAASTNCTILSSGASSVGNLYFNTVEYFLYADFISNPGVDDDDQHSFPSTQGILTPHAIAHRTNESTHVHRPYIDMNSLGDHTVVNDDWRFNNSGLSLAYGFGADDVDNDSQVEGDQFHCEHVIIGNNTRGEIFLEDMLRLSQDQSNYWHTPGENSASNIGGIQISGTDIGSING